MKLAYQIVLLFVILVAECSGRNLTDVLAIDIQNSVPIIINDDGTETLLTFNYTVSSETVDVSFIVGDTEKVVILSNFTFILNKTSQGTISLKVKGNMLGRTLLTILVYITVPGEGFITNGTKYKDYELVVSRKTRPIDTAFNVVIILLVVMMNVGMGCKVDLSVIKSTLKRPLAPGIGLFSQFLVMPVVSFLTVYLLDMEPAIALGYFALGCSPGGSASNVYTYLLGGDVSLSITMTLISTICSLGLLPMWLFTVGQMVLYKGTTMHIPYDTIFITLLGLIIPVVIGVIIQYKKPTWAAKILKLVKPIVIIFLIFVFSVGVYANLYIFKLLDIVVLLAGSLIPYCGFFLGFLISFVARQPRKNIITIAIETGIQNTGISIVLLRNSLAPPESDTSIVGPISAAIFTPIPLVIAIIVLHMRKLWRKKHGSECVMNMLDEPATFRKFQEGSSPKDMIEGTNSAETQ